MIENAIITEYYNKNNELQAYRITPIVGYQLHVKTRDSEIFDKFSNPTGEIELGFTNTFVQVHKSYDFKENILEIYSVPIEEKGEIA